MSLKDYRLFKLYGSGEARGTKDLGKPGQNTTGKGSFLNAFQKSSKRRLLTSKQTLILLLLIVVTLLLLLYSWQSWQMVHLSSKLIEAEEKAKQLEEERMILQFKVNQAFSLERIERLAKGKLGMIEPPEIKWIKLKEDQ